MNRLKSAANHFLRYYALEKIDLSIEALFILVGHWAAKLPGVKV